MNVARGLNLSLFKNSESINITQKQEDDTLEKGVLSEGVASLNLQKEYTGSEIADAIMQMINKLDQRCQELQGEMNKMKGECEQLPQEPCPEWKVKTCLNCFDEYPKMYSHFQIKDICVSRGIDQYKCPAYLYNELLGQYIDCLGDKQNGSLAIKHLKEDGKYYMNTRQAAALGLK